MRLVSFDALRVLGFPNTVIMKPGSVARELDQILAADWLLFPEYWQVNGLVFGLKKQIFPSLPTYLIGHNKIEMTRAFELVVPKNTPHTLILANTPSEAEHAWDTMTLPFVAKLPRSCMGEGVWLIDNWDDWRDYLGRTDVIYVQEYLPIDRDLRIVWVGDRVLTAYWRMQSSNGFHNNIARGGRVGSGLIPPAALALVEHFARTTGIDHAGFDVAMVGGHPYLIEFNRIFGNQGLDNDALRTVVIEYLMRSHQPGDPDAPVPVLPTAV